MTISSQLLRTGLMVSLLWAIILLQNLPSCISIPKVSRLSSRSR